MLENALTALKAALSKTNSLEKTPQAECPNAKIGSFGFHLTSSKWRATVVQNVFKLPRKCRRPIKNTPSIAETWTTISDISVAYFKLVFLFIKPDVEELICQSVFPMTFRVIQKYISIIHNK